jgi:hypothetical protein
VLGQNLIMDEGGFWDLIDGCRAAAGATGDDVSSTYLTLVEKLSQRSIDDIHAFDVWWNKVIRDAYRWDIWGAAHLINNGASDDGFQYFREWLILRGQPTFRATIDNPDSLAEIVTGDQECEYECYPETYAWEAATGSDDDNALDKSRNEALRRLGLSYPTLPAEPSGENWDFEDEQATRERLPRLTKRFFGKVASWWGFSEGEETW